MLAMSEVLRVRRGAQEVVVLGAGMIGVSTALELALRGHHVTLVDRRAPGRETSYGNAGIIQREAYEPYALPRSLPTLLAMALGRRLDVRCHANALWASLPELMRYWWNSAPAMHRVISQQYASLIVHAGGEHERYMALSGAEDMLRRPGLRLVYRTPRALDESLRHAERLRREYGAAFAPMDGGALAAAEPALRMPLAGAVHWLDSWSVSDPGELVERYANAFVQRGGHLVIGDADSLQQTTTGWQVDSAAGRIQARHAVVALGPWADRCTRRLGYRLPLFVKRGYHRHYVGGDTLGVPTMDAERGYVLAPQRRGLRITTGAELALLDAPRNLSQLVGAEAQARMLLNLGAPVESDPWFGSRPCSADMKPLIGPAPRHPGLWFNFGHGHQGFTLGPASARLLADLFEGTVPYTDPAGFLPSRFKR